MEEAATVSSRRHFNLMSYALQHFSLAVDVTKSHGSLLKFFYYGLVITVKRYGEPERGKKK
jgi:hypothetical protein